MTNSPREPAKWSEDCPVCTNRLRLEPSAMFGEATCTHCGGALWFVYLDPHLRVYEFESSVKIRERVLAFVAARLKIDPQRITQTTFSFEDLGTDSLETIELVMNLEKEIDSL